MSVSCRLAARSCSRQLSTIPAIRSSVAVASQRRYNSSDAPVNPKITPIVDQISQLTLLETADLVSALKSRLNIPDLPVGGSFAAAPPPSAAAAAAAAAEAEADAAAPAAAEKTLFAVKLLSFEAGTKPKIIKEVKSLLGLSLVESKKFVESAPKVMKDNVPKEDAEKMKETLTALGAKVEID
ncbi:hypothetical protein MKZ38_006155 [Zalerion maritima]|uniref:Uncharacterized protein n=1 Tax=Zalerion maritima TaxID=339359 RepID=A0AAD5RJ73_9PEZI|nr:hypothetical protein MKZ38_006155 [Zalerion maritima]